MQAGRITRCMTGALVIMAYLVMVLPGSSQDNSMDRIVDPQFRIVVVPSGQTAKFLEKNVREAFVPMPSSEFEKLTKNANSNIVPPFTPALTQAGYQAEWKENGIIGKATWVFNSSSKKQSYFPILPFNLAIKKASWKTGEALLGDFIQGTTSLLIPENNESACELEWSLKTEQLPDGHHLSLRIPPAALQSFELTIPFNWNFILGSKGSIEALSSAPNSTKKVLKIIASGETKIDLLLQDPSMHGRFDGLRVEKLQASHEIAPEATYSEFAFSFDGLTNGSNLLEFEFADGLKILEVISNQVKSWKILSRDNSSVLEIMLHNNLCRPDKILVKSLDSSVIKKSSLWKTPWMRFIALPSYREEISITANAGIRLEDLYMGDFLLAETGIKQMQGTDLRFIGGGLVSQKGKTYPSIKVSVGGAQFRTHQEVFFQPTLSGASLQANISYYLLNGSISSLLVQLPAGWEVEQLSLNADTHIKDWSVLQNQGKQILRVELDTPLVPSNPKSLDQNKSRTPALVVRLSPDTKTKKTNLWGFPAIQPVNSILNEGFFAIQYDALSYQAKLKSDLIEIDGQGEGQNFKQPFNHLFKFVEIPPSGSIELIPLTGVSNLRMNSTMVFENDRIDSKLDILLGSENGQVDKFDLLLPKGVNPESWKWISPNRNISFKKIEKISIYDYAGVLAGLSPLPGISLTNLSTIISLSDCWRFHLIQPMSGKETINFNATFSTPLSQGFMEVPLIGFTSNQRFTAFLQVESPKTSTIDFQFKGLKLLPSTKPKIKNFVYDSSSPWLSVKTGREVDAAPYGIIEQSILEKSFHANGRIQNQLKLKIKEWDNDFLEVTLPVKSDVTEIRINNKIVSNFVFKENKIRIPCLATSFANPSSIQFVIIYQEDAPKGWLWKTIDCNYPGLPVAPLDNNIYWLIPTGMESIAFANTNGSVRGLNGGEKPKGVLDYLFPLNYLLGSKPLNYDNSEDAYALLKTIVQQKPVLKAADSGKFNELIKSMQLYLVKNDYSLVLDHGCAEISSLGIAGILPDVSKTISENLDILGLKLVPISNVILLTNSNTAAFFKDNKSARFAISPVLEDAVAQGMDKSKRYVSAWKWVLDFPNLPQVFSSLSSSQSVNVSNKTRLQLFQETEPLTLVDAQHIQAAGLVLAFILLAFLSIQKIPFMHFIEPVLVLLAGLLLSWLPPPLLPLVWWFFIAWCLKKLGQYAIFIATYPIGQLSQQVVPASLKSASLFLAFLFLYTSLYAQPAKPFDVYLLAESASSVNEATYLVPELMIKQFRDKRLPITIGKAFITNGQYEGIIVDNNVTFKALWIVHCTGPSNLELPVSGGWLTDKVFLNDLPAYPVTRENGMITLAIPNKGDHVLRAEFKVGVLEKLSERTATFRLPISPINSFQVEFPANAEQPTLAGNLGAMVVARSGNVTKLNADLGKVSGTLSLRWSKGPLPPKSKPMIQEAYLWDIALDASRLEAFWDLKIPEAGTDFFQIDLPPNLLPSTLNPIIRPGLAPVALTNWNLKPIPMGQRLTLNFSRRISGALQIQAFFLPMNGLTSRWQLPLPTPVGVFLDGGSFLAYKSTNCNTTRQILPLRLTGINSKSFAPFWPETEKPEPETLAFAYSFRREPNNPPVLTLDISPAHFKYDATQAIKGNVQIKSSQFSINATLKSALPNILFVEWQIDGSAKYIVSKLVGDGVRSWSQNGSKVVIWLEKPVKEFSFVADILAANTTMNEIASVEIPRSTFPFATTLVTNIFLSHDTNVLLKPINLNGFGKFSDPMKLLSEGKNYQAQFEIKPLLPSGVANVVLSFENKDKITRARVDVELNRTKDDFSNYEFSIRGWEEEDLKFDLPPNIKLEPLSNQENIRKWSLIIPDTQKKGVINFSIYCDISKSLATEVAKIPVWNFTGVESISSWIFLPNEVLSMGNTQGLMKVSNLGAMTESPLIKKKLAGKPAEYYKVNSKSWGSNLRLNNQRLNREESLIVVYATLQGEVQKNGAIKGTSEFWLYFPVQGAFKVSLPKPLEFMSCHLDGVLIYPENIEEDQRYEFKALKSGFQKLKISFQSLVGDLRWVDFINKAPVLTAKSGFKKTIIIGTKPFQSWKLEPSALYVQELAVMETQARSLLEVSRSIAKEASSKSQDLSSLQPIQDLFFQIVARANVLESLTENGTESQIWEEELLQKNRDSAIELKYEPIAAIASLNADKTPFNDISSAVDKLFNPKMFVLSERETPPDLGIILKRGPEVRLAPLISAVWIGLMIVLYFFSSLRKFHKIIVVTWPEQFLLVGIGAYIFFGLNIIVLVCFISGVAGRIFVLLFFRKVLIQSLQFK